MKNYCKEKLQKTLYLLTVHPGNMRERLLYVQDHLETVNMSIPPELRTEWNLIWKELVKYTPNPGLKKIGQDDFIITVQKRKNQTLGQIVERIYIFHIEHFE